jgi:NitT/TauT family transport system permease protein
MSAARQSVLRVLLPILLFVLFLGAWEGATRTLAIPRYLLPGPLNVSQAGWENAAKLVSAAGVTAAGALCGFTASLGFGTLIAVVFSQSVLIRRSFFPYAIFLQTVPIVAIAPLIVLWSGTGFRSVVIVAFIVSLFPIVTNATAGLTAIDPDLLDLFRLHDASRWQTLIKLRLPHSAPSIVTGAKTSSGLAVIGTIVGEFFVGYGADQYGLGYLVQQSSDQLKTDLLFCAVLLSTGLGLLVFLAVSLAGTTILRRWYDAGHASA